MEFKQSRVFLHDLIDLQDKFITFPEKQLEDFSLTQGKKRNARRQSRMKD